MSVLGRIKSYYIHDYPQLRSIIIILRELGEMNPKKAKQSLRAKKRIIKGNGSSFPQVDSCINIIKIEYTLNPFIAIVLALQESLTGHFINS